MSGHDGVRGGAYDPVARGGILATRAGEAVGARGGYACRGPSEFAGRPDAAGARP